MKRQIDSWNRAERLEIVKLSKQLSTARRDFTKRTGKLDIHNEENSSLFLSLIMYQM